MTAAWADLGTASSPLWSVINFAPAYEGIPDKDFDAAKGIADPTDIGLAPTKTDGVDTYKDKGGMCLVNLPEAVDGWAAKDLRSYLQRPVINFGRVLQAIQRKARDLGYTFDMATLDDSMGDYWVDDSAEASYMWLTLPQLTSLTPSAISGASMTKTGGVTATNPVATWSISGTIPSGTRITVSISTEISFYASTVPMPSMNRTTGSLYSSAVLFVRLVGKASGTEVASSKIVPINIPRGLSPLDVYHEIGGTGEDDDSFAAPYYNMGLTAVDATHAKMQSISLTMEGYDYDTVELNIVRYGFVMGNESTGVFYQIPYSPVGTPGIPYLASTTPTVSTSFQSLAGIVSDTVSFDAPTTIRSGSYITKRALLGSTKTPAQYLISFAKTFGLYFAVDKSTKVVTLCKRWEFFDGGTIDLTKRVDLKSITIKPVAVDSKFYEFKSDVKGEFETEYESLYGRTYGSQRVNTGYQFNDDVKDIISNSVLRGAVTALERSKYFNYIIKTGDSSFFPSLFLDTGVTYTLWTTGGKSLDIDIQIPASSDIAITYYNTDINGYDIRQAKKLQLHSADGKAVAGEDILVFYVPTYPAIKYPYFKVSDDDAAMVNLTGGKGCWDIGPGSASGIFVPSFQRIAWRSGGYHANSSMDFGDPFEFAFYGETIEYGDDISLYARAWKSYLHDRYDGDTKVMTCKVDLAGLHVDASLLRNFYYFENALWVLNKISNYAITEHAPVQCEFVQVQDKDNYVDGQNFE